MIYKVAVSSRRLLNIDVFSRFIANFSQRFFRCVTPAASEFNFRRRSRQETRKCVQKAHFLYIFYTFFLKKHIIRTFECVKLMLKSVWKMCATHIFCCAHFSHIFHTFSDPLGSLANFLTVRRSTVVNVWWAGVQWLGSGRDFRQNARVMSFTAATINQWTSVKIVIAHNLLLFHDHFSTFSRTTAQPPRSTSFWRLGYPDMVKPLPESKREAIKVRLEEGVSHFAISEEMCVSLQTVKNYSSNLKSFGDVILPSNSRQGRPPIMTWKMVEVRISKAQWSVLLFAWR